MYGKFRGAHILTTEDTTGRRGVPSALATLTSRMLAKQTPQSGDVGVAPMTPCQRKEHSSAAKGALGKIGGDPTVRGRGADTVSQRKRIF